MDPRLAGGEHDDRGHNPTGEGPSALECEGGSRDAGRMDLSAKTLAGSSHWADLHELAASATPMVSVYMATEGDIVNAGVASLQRWGNLRSVLEDQDAPASALDRIEALVADAHMHGACLAAFASADALVHVEHGPDAPPSDFASWDGVPVISPLIRWRQQSPPYVVVLTDRRGADITVVPRHGDREVRSVDGDHTTPMRKVAPGGWSQSRYQRRAENSWEANARQIADEVQRASDEVGAEVIVVAGDVRAVELLEHHLPDRTVRLTEHVAGGRSAHGSDDAVAEEAHRWVMTAAARSTVAVLETFREARGQQDRAVEGVVGTLHALEQGRVELLLVHHDWSDDRRAWFGDGPVPVSAGAEELRELGVTTPKSSLLVDVAIRAALGTSAGVWVVPGGGGPAEGIGALLRW